MRSSEARSIVSRSDEGSQEEGPADDLGQHFLGLRSGPLRPYLVPLLFEVCAEDLAERVAAMHLARVLETAAGTGALTRALARRLPAGTTLVATDLNQPMLDHAAARQAPTSASPGSRPTRSICRSTTKNSMPSSASSA